MIAGNAAQNAQISRSQKTWTQFTGSIDNDQSARVRLRQSAQSRRSILNHRVKCRRIEQRESPRLQTRTRSLLFPFESGVILALEARAPSRAERALFALPRACMRL